jgi:peptide deformylase
MAVREILRYPHPALKQRARPLEPGEHSLVARVASDLIDTMRANARCVGVAAPQLAEPVRMVAVDVTGHPKATTCAGLVVLVNPRLTRTAGAEVGREGCLSIPDLTANVRRPTSVSVAATDPGGAALELDAEAFEARCLAHELDHLDGILFLDRVDSLKTDVFRRKRY